VFGVSSLMLSAGVSDKAARAPGKGDIYANAAVRWTHRQQYSPVLNAYSSLAGTAM
jgi:hypothetical protein